MRTLTNSFYQLASFLESSNDDLRIQEFVEIVLALADQNIDQAKESLESRNFTADELWELISREKLKNFFASFPAIYEALPTPLPTRLIRHQALQEKFQSRYIEELLSLSQQLEQAGIQSVAMKGPVLGTRLYHDPLGRRFFDIDLLVPEAKLDQVTKILFSRGYFLKKHQDRISPQKIRLEHAVAFSNGEIYLDLHWKLRNRPSYKLNLTEFFTNTVEIELGGSKVNSLSLEHHLLLMQISAIDDISRGALRVRHFLDMYLLIKQVGEDINWKQYFQERVAENTFLASLNTFSVLQHLLDERELPVPVQEALQENASLIVVKDKRQACQLFTLSKTSMVGPAWSHLSSTSYLPKDIKHQFEKTLPHPGRIFQVVGKSLLRITHFLYLLVKFPLRNRGF